MDDTWIDLSVSSPGIFNAFCADPSIFTGGNNVKYNFYFTTGVYLISMDILLSSILLTELILVYLNFYKIELN